MWSPYMCRYYFPVIFSGSGSHARLRGNNGLDWGSARGLLSKINANLNYTSACGPAVCSVLLVDCSCVLSIAPSTMLDPLSVPVPGILASATFLQMGKESQEATVRLGPAQKGGRRGGAHAGAVRLLTEMILHPAVGVRIVIRRAN